MLRQVLGVVGIASVLLAAPLSAAGAADMPYKVPAYAPPPAPVYSWTGCYVDAGVGYGFWDQKHNGETDPGFVAPPGFALVPSTVNSGGEGWLGRVGGGCDYQTPLFNNRLVIGAFADYDFTDLSGTFQDSSFVAFGNEKESGAWATGARVGYLVTPSLLAYFEGGYTQARFDSISLVVDPAVATGFFYPAQTYHGWFIGGGTEYALSGIVPINGLFWRNEYRYAQYQSATLPLECSCAAGPLGYGSTMQKDLQTITSGLVWRFDFGGR
jgi:outer membrane immunogenic protein